MACRLRGEAYHHVQTACVVPSCAPMDSHLRSFAGMRVPKSRLELRADIKDGTAPEVPPPETVGGIKPILFAGEVVDSRLVLYTLLLSTPT